MNHHFLAYCLSTPWALEPGRMSAYAAVLARRYAGIKADLGHDGEEHIALQAASARKSGARQGSIAVIAIQGAISQHASAMDICDGGTSTQQISAALQDALQDETVAQILLNIDSPGGSVYGVGTLAADIRAARAQKPVVAVANSLAASAAYWLGCSAGEFYMDPGAEVGSIGVWMAHQDMSKAMADAGVTTTLISAGKFKTEGNPYSALDADGLAFLQSRTDDYYSAFTTAVAKGRNVPIESVRNGMGQGRVLGASQAMSEKMVDGVMSFSDVVKQMQRSAVKPAGRGRSALIAAQNEMQIIE
jgi:signal peptide peptidase SppA